MFKTIINAWKIPELRKKILFTVLILVIYRFGNAIPIPFIDSTALKGMFSSQGENAFYGYLNMLTGVPLLRQPSSRCPFHRTSRRRLSFSC